MCGYVPGKCIPFGNSSAISSASQRKLTALNPLKLCSLKSTLPSIFHTEKFQNYGMQISATKSEN